jgi:lysophospholipase L1-like esterase
MLGRHSVALAAVLGVACNAPLSTAPGDGTPSIDGGIEGWDASIPAPDAAPGDEPDGGVVPPAPARVLYPEGQLHSPITSDMMFALRAIAQQTSRQDRVFAKVGDSITATDEFLACFDDGPVDLGSRGALSPSLTYFRAGTAAGTSPFARWSFSAVSGWTTADVLAGSPPAVEREISATSPRYGVVMLGTNDLRFGRSYDAVGGDLWTIIDRMLAGGVIPILSTIPANREDASANARVPVLNRIVRAIAQGRGIPLVDYHFAMRTLANQGISSDQIHPSSSPQGSCILTDTGLAYGYNLRNALTLEALDRARRTIAGETLDGDQPRRSGRGTQADPYTGSLPLVDLRDTRTGELGIASYCGLTAGGHEVVYQINVSSPRTIQALIVDRGAVNVDVAILQGSIGPSGCRGSGDGAALASVSAGTVYIVVDSRALTSEGEFLLVVQ